MNRRVALVLAGVLLLASQVALPPIVAQPAGDGTLFVYLQSLPSDIDPIAFSLGEVSATSAAGAQVPLKLALTTVKAGEARRQRLLASGPLPAGSYVRLSITIPKASVRRERGEAALLPPDTPVSVEAPFNLRRGGAVVLWLTLNAGGSLTGGVSFSPAFTAIVAPRPVPGRAGFISTPRANSVTVFDKRFREAAAVIATAAGPAGMVLDQRGGRLYVACTRDDEIQEIDVTAGEVVERARLSPGDGPREVALTPDGRTLLSANATSNSVTVFDASPLTRLERISVGSGPASLLIDASGRRAFVLNTLSNSISVVDIATRTVAATISTDPAPLRGRFSPRGDRLYVLHERSPYLTVIDPLQLTVLTRARLRIGLEALAVDARRGLLYAGGRDDPIVDVYDPNTLLPMGALKSRAGVSYLAIDADENALYMVSPGTRSVVVGGLGERKPVAETDVGEAPYWVSVPGER